MSRFPGVGGSSVLNLFDGRRKLCDVRDVRDGLSQGRYVEAQAVLNLRQASRQIRHVLRESGADGIYSTLEMCRASTRGLFSLIVNRDWRRTIMRHSAAWSIFQDVDFLLIGIMIHQF